MSSRGILRTASIVSGIVANRTSIGSRSQQTSALLCFTASSHLIFNMASACVLIMANEQLMLRPIQNLKSRASTCIIISIAVVCVCILVVCGVMIAREYSLATDYKEASCRLANTTARNDIICWYCANNKVKTNDKGGTMPNCVQSQFPCIQISVAYTVQSQLQHSVLHPDSIQATGPYNQASSFNCYYIWTIKYISVTTSQTNIPYRL